MSIIQGQILNSLDRIAANQHDKYPGEPDAADVF